MAKKLGDYINTSIPREEVDRKTFDVNQRRAELLAIILERGSFKMPVHSLAERYGVSIGQISHYKAALIKYINENLIKPDKIISDIFAAKQKAKEEAIKDRNWKAVDMITNSMLDMAYNLGVIKKEAERVDLTLKEKYEGWFKPKPKIVIKDEDLK